jgi:hypothetical protein
MVLGRKWPEYSLSHTEEKSRKPRGSRVKNMFVWLPFDGIWI